MVLILSFILLSAVILGACSGHSPLGPSNPEGVVLKGSVLGLTVSTSASSASVRTSSSATAAAGVIIVTVQENPAITTTVGADGSFTLRGLPAGAFTLVFTQDGAILGTLTFSAVLPNQEITITVDVSSGIIVLVEEQRNGIGQGDIEIEGLVQQVLTLNPAGESRFLINDRTVVARPGETTIREGNQPRAVSDVTVGRRVHVKGVFLPLEGSVQPVLAKEIILQGEEDETTTPGCNINGGRVSDGIELEGSVAGGGASNFVLQVKGNRAKAPVQVDASGASFECHPKSGPNAPTPDQCKAKVKAGAQVHVSGTLESCDASSALVRASKVIVQK